MRANPSAFIKAANHVTIAAMKSSNAWVDDTKKYNGLLSALLMTADNLTAGRPSSEDPDFSAAWGSLDLSEINLAFTLLHEVAEHRGDTFLNSPNVAAAMLQNIALHLHALNLLNKEPDDTDKWLQERAERFERTDPSYAATLRSSVANRKKEQQPTEAFSWAPLWPLEPVDKEEARPMIVSDGHCGHYSGVRQSACSICCDAWLKAYEESLAAVRDWERRMEEKRVAAGKVRNEAERLLNDRRRELYGVKECERVHARKIEKGSIFTSTDGRRTWTFMGGDPQDPSRWDLIPNFNRGGISDPQQISQWNETGLKAE